MPRGIYQRKTSKTEAIVETKAIEKTVASIVPANAFAQMQGWDKLSADEQGLVQTEGHKLAEALLAYGHSRLAVGEHLAKLRDVLEPHNLFGRFLKNFHFSKRTAYRYMAAYDNAQKILPRSIVEAAAARNVNILGESEQKPLGIYTNAARVLPPPQNPTVEQANVWLDQVEEVRKKQPRETGESNILAMVPANPEEMLRECYKFVSNRYKRLPANSKQRAAWVRTLVGMILTELGVSGQQAFAPVAIPEAYRVGRGRPKTATAATA